VNDAPVLLCDEPTASVDGHTGGGVLEALRLLAHREDRAVVIVTHDERVLPIADRLVRVVDGRVASAEESRLASSGRVPADVGHHPQLVRRTP
jgi:putative ABC transport system ATP-binding protein